jgi:hypothetical protein
MRRVLDVVGDLVMLALVTLLFPVAILLIGLPIVGVVKLASLVISKAMGIGV